MRIAIAGGLGFIGSSIAGQALQLGHEITVLTRIPINDSEWIHPKLKILGAGDPIDLVQWQCAVGDCDAVILATGSGGPAKAHQDPQEEIARNLLPAAKLVQECIAHKARKIILISSAGTVYGETPVKPADEESQLNPSGLYGATKAALEMYIRAICSRTDTKMLIVRLSNPYGPWQLPGLGQGLIPNAIEAIEKSNIFCIWGSGLETRDYIHIDDAADAFIKLCESTLEGIVNLSSGISTSTLEVLELLERATGKQIKRKNIIQPFSLPSQVEICNNKITSRLEWAPSTSLLQGINATIEWYQDIYSKLDHSPTLLSATRLKHNIFRAILK